jgi:bla regulator protein BlaR1
MSPTYLAPFANHLWQSTLVAGVAGLIILALRSNQARVRHWVWLAASCKFLIPLSVLVALGDHIQWWAAPAITPSNLSAVTYEVTQPFTAPPVSSPLLAAVPRAAISFPEVLWGVWACGFLGITCAWWVRWRRIEAAVRAGSPVHLEIPIKVMSSPTLLEPGVFGVFRPVLLLPECIFARLTPTQLNAVIAHELCHVRHRDNLVAAIHMLVETVFWFHPLVWWIGKRMVEERERACDEEVLRRSTEPLVYAEGILNVCKLYVESPLVCVAGVTGSNLKKRITEIMAHRIAHNRNCGKRILLAAVAVGAAAGPVAIGFLHAPVGRAQSQATVASAKFEVASIKPTDPTFDGRLVEMPPDDSRVTIRGMTLKGLIQIAYNPGFGLLHPSLVTGGPKWYDHNRYDIFAKSEGHRIPSHEERKQMLKALLEERFKLTFHRESKRTTVLALTAGKNGPRMKEGTPDSSGAPSTLLKGRSMTGRNASMAELAAILQPMMPLVDPTHADFPVLDRTGLTGRFDFNLAWAPDETEAGEFGGTPPNSNLPDLFTAIQEQLGLNWD